VKVKWSIRDKLPSARDREVVPWSFFVKEITRNSGRLSAMRFVTQSLTVAVFCTTVAMTGCGCPANTDPKPVIVKEDPRIQRAGVGGAENKVQPNLQAK
jgi:hypothetical protein